MFIELSYILTLLIGVACFTVHMTVRSKNLTSVSPLVKWKSTTAFLMLVIVFNICDFLIIYLGDAIGEGGIAWIYVIENVLEVFMAYAMICMCRDYAMTQNPRWVDVIFVVAALTILYADSMFTIKGDAYNEGIYISGMIVLNMIPVGLLAYFGRKYWKMGNAIRSHRATNVYMLILSLIFVLICLITTASVIDSRTTKDLIWWDKEIYVMCWLAFNTINLVFMWRSCIVDERGEIERTQTAEERMDMIVTQYGLSSREREIAELIFEGKHNKEIAAILYLSPNTVKVHASNLYRKLGAINRVQAAAVLRGEEIPHNTHLETEEE